jgi:hypothetical protein
MENDKQPAQLDSGPDEGVGVPAAEGRQDELREEYRSMSTDIAALAMPVAVVAAPVVNQWAKQHFADKPKEDAAPASQPEQQKTD